jgi:hypothetical protein
VVAANGGAGGSGVDEIGAALYAPAGQLGAQAATGDDVGANGPGGNGSSAVALNAGDGLPAVPPLTAHDGGGGGGGGAGFIMVWQTPVVNGSAIFSPPLTQR